MKEMPLRGIRLVFIATRKHHSPQIKPTLIDGQDYSSKVVVAGSVRLLVIGGDAGAGAKGAWVAARLQNPVHFPFGLEPSRTFQIIEKYVFAFISM